MSEASELITYGAFGWAWSSIVTSVSALFVATKDCSMSSIQEISTGFGFPATAWKRGRSRAEMDELVVEVVHAGEPLQVLERRAWRNP